MKNKLFVLGMFGLALTFGLVAVSCNNSTTDDFALYSNKMPAAVKVDAFETSNKAYVVVSFQLPASADGAGYQVFIKPEGKKAYSEYFTYTGGVSNRLKYDKDGANSKNDDRNTYYGRIPVGNSDPTAALLGYNITKGTYNFGVVVASNVYHPGIAPSDVVWSQALTVTEP